MTKNGSKPQNPGLSLFCQGFHNKIKQGEENNDENERQKNKKTGGTDSFIKKQEKCPSPIKQYSGEKACRPSVLLLLQP